MKTAFKAVLAGVAAIAIVAMGSAAVAKVKNADTINFNPATDGGKYMTIHQSKTLSQWGFNVGMYMNYAYEPLEYADSTGQRIRGIVDDLFTADFHAAIGFFDWWTMGVNFPLIVWESFINPNVGPVAAPKQNLYAKPGDLRVEMKFRLLDIDKHNVGIALVPFFYLPTGKSSTFLGNGMWSPGGKLVIDGDIKNRVFLAANAGYRYYQETRYDNNNPNAVIDDTIEMGGGINVRINDSWAILGEIYGEFVADSFWANELQNPLEFLVGGRWTPQTTAKGLAVTAAAGRGITRGVGSPDARVLVGVNYRREYVPPPPPPVAVAAKAEEKIVITQKIHFEFDRSRIRAISYPILNDVVEVLKRNPQITKLRVEGHTDWVGSDRYNQGLSERRANSVRRYLIKKGIAPDRLVAVGYGEKKPVADNTTVLGRAKNRRVEFTVIQ
jgi:outer membrane protein OmpA-like peptidoglycan-associated protein